jgi:hypothetical protein
MKLIYRYEKDLALFNEVFTNPLSLVVVESMKVDEDTFAWETRGPLPHEKRVSGELPPLRISECCAPFSVAGRKVGAAACRTTFLAFVGAASLFVPTMGTRPSPKIMGCVATISFQTL